MEASKQIDGSTDHTEVWLQAMKPSYTTTRLTSASIAAECTHLLVLEPVCLDARLLEGMVARVGMNINGNHNILIYIYTHSVRLC